MLKTETDALGNIKISGTASTADATPLIAATFPLVAGDAYTVRGRVTANAEASADRAAYELGPGTFYRDGVASAQLEETFPVVQSESEVLWGVAVGIGTNSVDLTLTGEAGTDINWTFELEAQKSEAPAGP